LDAPFLFIEDVMSAWVSAVAMSSKMPSIFLTAPLSIRRASALMATASFAASRSGSEADLHFRWCSHMRAVPPGNQRKLSRSCGTR
jgi:hypothetical protein